MDWPQWVIIVWYILALGANFGLYLNGFKLGLNQKTSILIIVLSALLMYAGGFFAA